MNFANVKGILIPQGEASAISIDGANVWNSHREPPQWVTSASGRRFIRHQSNKGTIMEWNNCGTLTYTLVLDAAYRRVREWYSAMADFDLPTYTSVGYPVSANARLQGDAVLNAKTQSNQDTRTNKTATDAIIAKIGTSDSYAAGHCRSILIDGIGCDLPTVNCLSRIYDDAVILDSMDPTKTSEKNLTSWAIDKRGYPYGDRWWTSSWYGKPNDRSYAQYVYSDGQVNAAELWNAMAVCPVLDITL